MPSHELTRTISQVIDHYPDLGQLVSFEQLLNGHINDTYILILSHGAREKKVILQRINEYVFKEPKKVMDNIRAISNHLKCVDHQDDCEIIQFYDNRDGMNHTVVDGGTWRICPFIENSVAYETVENLAVLESAGYAFGRFQCVLADLPMDQLSETIPGFHHTSNRLKHFFQIVQEDPLGRASTIQPEIAFFEQYRELASSLIDKQEKGELPLRVTHNDTKYNNILMDRDTGKPLCVIDLDTVMPGLTVYDYGDAIRFAANRSAEDETDLSKVGLDMDYYQAFTRGFVRAAQPFLTPAEVDNLALGAVVITIELASRFLGDHIQGDKYFHIHRPDHNLDRARSQIALAQDMISKLDIMNATIRSCISI